MSDYGFLGETTGYPYPKPFQPNQKGIAKRKKSVIKRSKGKKPIVKKRKKYALR